jgi:HK97 family phage prohead protease
VTDEPTVPTKLMRAHALFQMDAHERKVVDGKEFAEIRGIATTPTPDRMGDIVMPKGARFKLPLSMLWQHSHMEPVGEVVEAKPNDKSIPVVTRMPLFAEAKAIKDRIEEAYESVKLGLVRGFSIGFTAKAGDYLLDPENYTFVFNGWEWLELSLVTIPANAEATISAVRAFDAARLTPEPVRLSAEHVKRARAISRGDVVFL